MTDFSMKLALGDKFFGNGPEFSYLWCRFPGRANLRATFKFGFKKFF